MSLYFDGERLLSSAVFMVTLSFFSCLSQSKNSFSSYKLANKQNLKRLIIILLVFNHAWYS